MNDARKIRASYIEHHGIIAASEVPWRDVARMLRNHQSDGDCFDFAAEVGLRESYEAWIILRWMGF